MPRTHRQQGQRFPPSDPREWRPSGPGDLYPSSTDPDPPPGDDQGNDTEPVPAGYGVGPSFVASREEYAHAYEGWADSMADNPTVTEQWDIYDEDYHYPNGKHPAPRAHSIDRENRETRLDIGNTGGNIPYPQDGAGWRATLSPEEYAPHGESVRPHVESRSPHAYMFTRDMHDGVKRLNGMAFSMADNMRTYPIGGMEPSRENRNTYRAEPPPRDDRIAPITGNDTVPATVSNQTPHNIPGKSFRL